MNDCVFLSFSIEQDSEAKNHEEDANSLGREGILYFSLYVFDVAREKMLVTADRMHPFRFSCVSALNSVCC